MSLQLHSLHGEHGAYVQISTMTNGSIAITKMLLQKSQLEDYVDLVMDVTQPKAWKPSPAAYSYAIKQLNLKAEQVRLCNVSLHAPDVQLTLEATSPPLLILHQNSTMSSFRLSANSTAELPT